MCDEANAVNVEPSKVDSAASDACTKAGAFALALAIVVALLAALWTHAHSEDALDHYITNRYLLQINLDRLKADPTWQQSDVITSSTSLAVLLHYYPRARDGFVDYHKASRFHRHEDTSWPTITPRGFVRT
jgi:hypothetical protein